MLNFDNYFEIDKEPIEELFEEYKQKCMEQICNSIETEINDIKENNHYLTKRNIELLQEIHDLKDEIKQLKQEAENRTFISSLIDKTQKSH